MDCYKAKEGCSGACREARDRVSVEKAAEEEKKAEREKDAEIAQRVLKRRIRERAAALLPYVEKAGLDDKARISNDWRSATAGQVRKWAAGAFGDEHFYGDECVRPGQAKDAIDMARKLGCSLELALGVREWTAAPKAADTEPAWRDGTPERTGWYAVRLLFLGKPLFAPRVFWWNGAAWVQKDEDGKERTIDRACEVIVWHRLPAEEGET